MCSGDPDLVRAVEDPAQATMDTTLWDEEQIQVSRYLYLILVMLMEDAALRIVEAVRRSTAAMCRRYNPLTQERLLAKYYEMLQVDLGTDDRTYMDNVVQWKQREFETMSRETLPDVVKEPSSRRDHHQQSQNSSVGQCPNLDEICDSAGSHWGVPGSGPKVGTRPKWTKHWTLTQ